MAVPNSTFDQLTAITEKYFVPRLQDNIFKARPLLARMLKKGPKINGGASLVVPIGYKAGQGGSYSGYDVLNSTANDEITAALFQWAQYYGETAISGREIMLNMGPTQVVDLLKAKVQIAEGGIRDSLNTDLYSTNADTSIPSQPGITGMQTVIKASRTYGTINSATSGNTFWDGGEQTSSKTLATAEMLVGWNTASNNSEQAQPDFIVTTIVNWNTYHAIMDSKERYQDVDTANQGFQNLTFMGKAPVVWDNAVAANQMFMLNTDHIQLYQHSERPIRFTGWRTPVTQDAQLGYFFWMGQLVCDAPRTQYKWTAIS